MCIIKQNQIEIKIIPSTQLAKQIFNKLFVNTKDKEAFLKGIKEKIFRTFECSPKLGCKFKNLNHIF